MPIDPFALIAHLAGMLAGYGVVVLVMTTSRAPGLERGIGADVLTRWHARDGRLVVVMLIMVHAIAAVLAWAGSRQEGLWLALGNVHQLAAVLAATAGTVILLAVAGVSARAARLGRLGAGCRPRSGTACIC